VSVTATDGTVIPSTVTLSAPWWEVVTSTVLTREDSPTPTRTVAMSSPGNVALNRDGKLLDTIKKILVS